MTVGAGWKPGGELQAKASPHHSRRRTLLARWTRAQLPLAQSAQSADWAGALRSRATNAIRVNGMRAPDADLTIGPMKMALSIAGSDPTGGAGLQADLQVFRSFGVHGAGVVTALTVQDRHKVHQVLPVFPSVVLDQLRVLLRDRVPDAVKIGMLASDDVLRSVLLGLSELASDVPIVVDPVLAASDGTPLLERRAWDGLRELIGRSRLTTPNLPEAEALSARDVSTREGCEQAGRSFVEDLGAQAALVKGGHRPGDPADLLVLRQKSGVTLQWLEGESIDAGPVRGTGCALASAVAASLVDGGRLEQAIAEARGFVARALRAAHGPAGAPRFLSYP